MCELHQGLRDDGKEVDIAPAPDTILVKFNINPRWAQRFEEAGVSRRIPFEVDLEEKHIAHALKSHRKPYRYRDIADSGVPVFGMDGVSKVSILELLGELQENGYQPQGVHIRTRRKRFDVLVIPFSQETSGERSLPRQAVELLREFLKLSCWGFAHIWANPPDDQGKIVHTVNLSHREPGKSPKRNLCFDHGLWAAAAS